MLAKASHRRESASLISGPRSSGFKDLGLGLLAIVWATTTVVLSSRIHLVMGYQTLPVGPAWLEPFLATSAAWMFAFGVALAWFLFARKREFAESKTSTITFRRAVFALLASCLPFALWLGRLLGATVEPHYLEPLWLSAFTGYSFAILSTVPWKQGQLLSATFTRGTKLAASSSGVWLALVATFVGIWWYFQSALMYESYLLGFNDFGHFAQRIANTAAGRGILMETPVLPSFWDHFNPGLLIFVPLWTTWPSVHLFFFAQAVCLSASALLIRSLAIKLQAGPIAASVFGLAWLAQPAVGQMNLAYTYGWHPITLAIPCLLGSLYALLSSRNWFALLLASLSCTFEEGVIVIVSCFCFANSAVSFMPHRNQKSDAYKVRPSIWMTLGLCFALVFLLVYQFSGIREFQTGRFIALGNSASEILLSPVLRPRVFWGQIFRWENLAFLLSLWLPCWIVGLIRGWKLWMATFLPLAVLIVWDHSPSTCLAFQYASTLLPVFWIATLHGSVASPLKAAIGALTTGLTLSLFVGQLPFSQRTLLDVIGKTYGADLELRRSAGSPDQIWLDKQVQQIHDSRSPVLATGRIAAHLVGNEELETAGQYIQRRPKLLLLPDRTGRPLSRYDTIILDRKEGFQQTAAEIAQIEDEAEREGFYVQEENYEIVVLQNPRLRPPPTTSP